MINSTNENNILKYVGPHRIQTTDEDIFKNSYLISTTNTIIIGNIEEYGTSRPYPLY